MPTTAPPPVEDLTLPAGARPDEFFSADQIRRLLAFRAKVRAAREGGPDLTEDERKEMFALIDEELVGMTARARKLRAEGKL